MKVVKVEIFPASNGFFLYLHVEDEEAVVSAPSPEGAGPIGTAGYGVVSPVTQVSGFRGSPFTGKPLKVITEVYESYERLFARLREVLTSSVR